MSESALSESASLNRSCPTSCKDPSQRVPTYSWVYTWVAVGLQAIAAALLLEAHVAVLTDSAPSVTVHCIGTALVRPE
jgi:hypothetical protein